MKMCFQCRIQKEIDLFHKDPSKNDGRYSICKECRRIRNGYGIKKRHRTTWGLDSCGYLSWKMKRQHRVLMEQKLGRKLYKKEHVHHINGIKIDNRIENLELVSEKDHHSFHSTAYWRNYWSSFPKEEFMKDYLSGMKQIDLSKKYKRERHTIGRMIKRFSK